MSSGTAPRLTTVQWLICFIASIGFAFDIYELLMLPLIVRPALMELGGIAPGTDEFAMWIGRLFYLPAIAGGVFGLLGGYLTDRLGRRRVLTYSILLYAVAAFVAGFSTSLWMLLICRCCVFVGVCVEFVAAVAWLAELFDDPVRREKVLGYTQAFSSIGGLMIAVANGLAVAYALDLPSVQIPGFLQGLLGEVKDPNAAWRYTLMSGLIPAFPLLIIRPFLPESPKWAEKKAAGTLRRPSFGELFNPQLRRTTVVTTIMFACSFGAAFGAIQQMPQMVPGLPEVQASVKAAVEKVSDKPKPDQIKAAKLVEQGTAANVTKVQEVGGLIGRVLLAILAVKIVSRVKLLRVFLIPGLIVMPFTFFYAAVDSLSMLYVGMFLAGLLTVGQFSFWGNYLPRVYPMHLRGLGESFAANIGGRLIGTSFAWVTSSLAVSDFLANLMPNGAEASPAAKVAFAAALIGTLVYAVNLVASFWLPEPPPEFED
ncbi:MAG: MFS transporter [Planctomycetota bacterium]|nr:MFS transporter [Planctomycetota bacterium]MDA1211213.1 MFS transporter [Planctomycetota bacterium]